MDCGKVTVRDKVRGTKMRGKGEKRTGPAELPGGARQTGPSDPAQEGVGDS